VKTFNGGGTIVRTTPWLRDKTMTGRIGPAVERTRTALMTEVHDDAGASNEANGQDGGEDFAFTPEDLVDWVEGLAALLESVDRSQNQYWCSQWWNHSEAVDRLRGLYEQWLEAQANGGMASWWIRPLRPSRCCPLCRKGPVR
jgi:hypothetical protein